MVQENGREIGGERQKRCNCMAPGNDAPELAVVELVQQEHAGIPTRICYLVLVFVAIVVAGKSVLMRKAHQNTITTLPFQLCDPLVPKLRAFAK